MSSKIDNKVKAIEKRMVGIYNDIEDNSGKSKSKKGQVTIFVIIAIVIVAAIAVFFIFRGQFGLGGIPEEFVPVYSKYSSCIEEETKGAIELAGTQGGRIFVEDYAPGSEYAPFSNQLNFLGFPVPYWYYVSGNGVIKENVPSKNDIENEIARYLEERINDCDFQEYYEQGFYIDMEEPEIDVRILDEKVEVNVNADIAVRNEENSARKSLHKIEIDSKLGKFYDEAKEIYDKQRKDAFLENYAVDVLRNYAPVDGVEITCAPKIWKTREVVEELKQGLEANIGAVKFSGGYYRLNEKEDEYFVVEENVDDGVQLLYSRNWPTKVEIAGADEELMVAEPVGNQEGLGILGFCYVPYHFVYDVSFPVLIQVNDGLELFQFPVVVIVDKNKAREAVFSELQEQEEFDLCEFKTQELEVNLYDINLNSADGFVSYSCFDQKCLLGETEEGRFVGKAPACVNGFLEVRADGFAEKKQLFSSNSESVADIILDREHEIEFEVEIDGKKGGNVVVNFIGEKTTSAVLPEFNKVKLSEGSYNISVYAYGNSSIVIPASVKRQCTQVARGGILGIFGGTREECFDINIPATNIDYALLGGGKGQDYFLESELEEGKMIIRAGGLPKPSSLEQLQYNYAAFENLNVEVSFNE